MTRFESSEDGIKSTTSKIADIEGVLVEEVLSEPEQEKKTPQTDVVIEEVPEDGKIFFFSHIFSDQLQCEIISREKKNFCINICSIFGFEI